ncbi:hypothetical protein ACLKA6_015721 [Drosophila palustris]
MPQLKAIFILLGLCVLAQTEAAFRQSVQDEEEDPAPQGRIFSIVRDTEPSRYPLYDSKPIIITSPSQPSYPQQPFYPPAHPPHPPVNYPQPIPFPVHVPAPYPQTIIKPIVYRPVPPHHHHGHDHGHHHHYGSGNGFANFPPFFNITYAPAAATTSSNIDLTGRIQEQMQANDINQLIQLLSAQTQPQFRPQIQQIQQLPQIQQIQQLQQVPQIQQYQVQSQALPVPVIYQPFTSNQDGTYTLADQPGSQSELLSAYLPADQLANFDLDNEQAQLRPKPQRTPILVRRQKPKSKSKRSKPKVQRLYIALNPVQQQETQAEAEAQNQADIMETAM